MVNHSQSKLQGMIESTLDEPISRRLLLKRSAATALMVSAGGALLAACSGDDETGGDDTDTGDSGASDDESTPEEDESNGEADESDEGADETSGDGQRGGRLIVAMIGEPPTLDIHQTTGTIVSLVTWNMYETLFTWDEEFNSIPMLAASHEVSDDGLLHTVTLREGVPFHNGEEMKAADVIASFKHWANIHGLGSSLLENSEDIVEVDDYTVEFHLSEPFGIFETAIGLANGGCAIYPKSVIDASDGPELTEFIGTGPYKFVERQPDRYIRLARFEDYAALEGGTQGYGGTKHAYVDEMEFVPVPDEAGRIAGLQAGDYHYLEDISPDQYEGVKDDESITAKVLPPQGWGIFILNWQSPIMGDPLMRQAFQAALDLEAICQAGYGEGYYRLDPGLMFQETVWHSDVGAELYNQADPDRARELLEEAGYNGEEIRWTTTQEYQDHYNRSLTATQQLEEAGFNIDLVVMDWATVLEEQFNPEAWDITTTGISFRPDPALLFIMDVCNVAGWWCSDETTELVNQLRSESDFDTRFELWEQIQQNAYEEVPFIKNGDEMQVTVHSAKLKNLADQQQLSPILHNVWLDE